MRSITNRALALGVFVLIGAADAAGQEAPPERPGRGPRGPDVESILSMRERLELTEEQVTALDALRAQDVQRRSAERAEVEEMRSRLRAGLIPRSELVAFLEERSGSREQVAEERQERIDGILGPDQRAMLDQVRAERRAFERGRRAGRREMRSGATRGWRGPSGGGDRAFRGRSGFEPRFERGLRSPRRPGGSPTGDPGLPDPGVDSALESR